MPKFIMDQTRAKYNDIRQNGSVEYTIPDHVYYRDERLFYDAKVTQYTNHSRTTVLPAERYISIMVRRGERSIFANKEKERV